MGTTLTDKYTEEQNAIALLLKAMAHPARIAIVDFLLQVDTCICRDIVNELPLSQATVSQHLKELKNAGIIQGSIEGTSICYCLSLETLAKLKKYFKQLHNTTLKKNDCCD